MINKTWALYLPLPPSLLLSSTACSTALYFPLRQRAHVFKSPVSSLNSAHPAIVKGGAPSSVLRACEGAKRLKSNSDNAPISSHALVTRSKVQQL